MKIDVVRADPAGNITALVLSGVSPERRAAVARTVLEKDPGCEQVGFIVPPAEGEDVHLLMMGGEFCGNALRSAGFWAAVSSGVTGRVEIKARISGYDAPLRVSVDAAASCASAEMPLPERMVKKADGYDVVFPGIVHRVCFSPLSGVEAIRRELEELAAEYGAAASGIMALDRDALAMRPAVYVRDTDTVYFENSCASGSAAAAAAMSAGTGDGERSYALSQPGGVITARVSVKNGVIGSIEIGGCVSLKGPFSLDLGI